MDSPEFDDKFKKKVWGLILKGYVDHFEPPRKRKNWSERLDELGIRTFQYDDPESGFIEVSLHNDSFMGGVHVPRDLAVKIVTLGYMP